MTHLMVLDHMRVAGPVKRPQLGGHLPRAMMMMMMMMDRIRTIRKIPSTTITTQSLTTTFRYRSKH